MLIPCTNKTTKIPEIAINVDIILIEALERRVGGIYKNVLSGHLHVNDDVALRPHRVR